MVNQELKRLEVKYIRDKAKSSYPTKKGKECRICKTTSDLQFHHFAGVSNLWILYKKKHKINIESIEDIEIYRDRFISTHSSELYDGGEFLCKRHHQDLHKIYGKSPGLGTVKKQKRWVEIQREKHNGNNN